MYLLTTPTYCRIGVILFSYLGLPAWEALAQLPTQASARLTTTNGLPHNSITGVEQDRAGFVWIATNDGLARYDGRNVKVFRNRPGDSLSLANNSITELLLAADGTFVVNTESGTIQQFDPTTERFTILLDRRFLDRNNALVNQVQFSADGTHLWGLLPNVRLIDYNIQRKTLRVYKVPALVGNNELHDFILTPTGQIYGETLTGLFQFDTQTGRKRIIPFPFSKPSGRYWSINYHRITHGPNGEIAVFGYQCIALYNPTLDRFRTIPIPDVRHQDDIWYMLKTQADNRLYLGYVDCLYYLDAHDRFTRISIPSPTTKQTAPWLLDRSGILWVGGRLAGLNQIDLHGLPFGFAPKRKSFCEDLLEQDLGVSLPTNYVVWDIDHWPRYSLSPTTRGYLIDPYHVYQHIPGQSSLTELTALVNSRNGNKLCLKVSRQGRIWLYSNNGGLVESDSSGTSNQLLPNSQLPLIDKYPGHDAADIQPIGQSVWVGSQYGLGLFRYNILHKRFDKILMSNRPASPANLLPVYQINCLCADPTDSTVLWIGTQGGGVCRLETRTLTFRRLGEPEGFPDGTIVSLETDNQGMLWCGTNHGLVRINPRTLAWRHFTGADGLAENSFLQTSSAHLPDGRLVFGTPNGRIIFNPAAIRDRSYEPPIVLTSLQINNQLMEANQPGSPLSAPLNTLTELVLDHTQNFLTITFASLDYGKADKLMYRYQLAGVDANWVTIGTQNTANYTQLAPGDYLFSVNGTTADGRWSHHIKRFKILIRPPFWATWWAYLIYALTFGSMLLGFIRFRNRQSRQQQEMTLKQREAEQLRAVDEVKTRFFSNITHEFRTPLTLILSPTEKLLNQAHHDAFTRQTLRSIHQSAGQLLRLINQLLDLAKLEGSALSVSLVRGDAVSFVQQLAENMRPMATSRGIALHIETDGTADNEVDGPWLFDADKWEKILTNLLANALKFTPADGQVSLFLELTTNQLRVRLIDTGIGIPPKHLPHIFDRFYQADDSRTRAYEGTGIGLALVKELIDLLGGTIALQSRTETPTGTTFRLVLPMLPATAQPDAPDLVMPHEQIEETGTALADTAAKPAVSDDAPLVLVVDDNDELRSFIAGELVGHYRVLTAADGDEGWDICRRELPDVVISDVMMPHRDGYQLTGVIKSTLATNHIAVVLLTAKAAPESRIAGLEQGADDYLTKPFSVEELLLRLDNMLTRQANLRTYIRRQLSSLSAPAEELVADAFVNQLHQAIESRLDDPTLGVNDLAEAVAMSRRTLHRKLTTTTSLSPNDFIRHYRLQRATQLLRAGQSIAEIAYRVGFESPSYFSAMFKQTYHQTPSEFLGR